MKDALTAGAEALVRELLQEGCNVGQTANDLYKLIWEGADVDTLRPLLLSNKTSAEVTAAWILSEAGAQGQPLLTFALPLAQHRNQRIRAYVVDFLVNQRSNLTEDSYRAVGVLLNDIDPAIRAYAIKQFSRAGIEAT